MSEQKKYVGMTVALLCVILILAYACTVFLPYSHGVCDSDCSVCARIERIGRILVAIVFCAAIYHLIDRERIISHAFCSMIQVCKTTPVGLKVKLSN